MIRPIRRDEAHATYAIYRDAVWIGAEPDYCLAARRAWVPSEAMEDWWPDRVFGNQTWVADRDGGLVGLISLRDKSYLDLFFVHPDARGDGTAGELYDALLEHARTLGGRSLTTHASLLARPFLERRGWQIVNEETVERHGVPLRRFEMTLAPIT